MSKSYDEGKVAWLDFEPEPDTTGDGSGDPDKHILTIADGFGTDTWPEEIAVIVHRTVGGKYPLDGIVAQRKRHNAQVICDALNANVHGETHAEKLWANGDNTAGELSRPREAVTPRRARIHELVDAEMNRTEENYTPGDEREWGRDDDKPSVEWYAADISRYMNRIAGNEE